MFSSSPLDKSCINSDSCSPGRNNPPNRLSVAVPVRDDSQQFRIQLAIHKYNGTAGSPLNSRCSFMSPVRHSFLKNSLKVRTYEGDSEGTSKTEKRNGNQYEGVGAFPTVHLKKSAVRYRPIRRFHDVKIPYPELPVNRFLSHLPEVCPDLKSSTRSVLDVLEDLSGNKIHSKDDSGSSKPKPRGLGGDYLLNPNSVYKPLFVQKPKLNSVLTRDNTTQTLSPVTVETPSPQSSSSSNKNGVSDPRAELRRKLAKQNNEIFASLSSSISSGFSLKRKIDKVLPGKDDGQSSDGSAQKKTKVVEQISHEHNENGLAKFAGSPKVSGGESAKSSRKSKLTETNSVSPNKDRLTTIFLDTRNTSPKAQVFHAKASAEANGVEKSLQKTANGVAETNGQDKSDGGSEREKCKDESGKGSASFSAPGKAALNGSGQQDAGQSDKPVVSFLLSRADTSSTESVKPSSPVLQPKVTDTANHNSQRLMSAAGGSEVGKSSPNGSESQKKENESKDLSKGFSYGSPNDKPNFGSFKFGAGVSSPLAQKSLTGSSSETVSVGVSAATSTPQFSFGSTSGVTMPALQTPKAQFAVTTAQDTSAAPAKAAFTFGQSASAQQTSSSTGTVGKPEASDATSTSTTITTQSSQPLAFAFGQKPSSATEGVSQTTNAVTFGSSLSKSPSNAAQSSGALFAFGAKAETSAASATPAQVQTKPFPFSFGQKPTADQSKTQGQSEEKGKTLFPSEPKPTTQLPPQETSASTASTPPTTTSAQATSTHTPAPQTSTTFGAKLEGNPLGTAPAPTFTAPNSTFPSKTLSFGSSVTDFGKTTTQTTSGFPTSTTTASTFTFGTSTTTQATPAFGIPPATQSPPTFGSPAFGNSSATPSAPAFGSSSTPQPTPTFPAPPTTQPSPSFGVSSAPQSTPTFGSSSNKQSAPSFGTTSTTHSTPTFGASSQPTPPFGSTSTTQATPFGLSSPQSTPVFGAPTSTQSPIRFGAPTSQTTTTTFGPSPGFSSAPPTQPTPAFGAPTPAPTPAFPASQSFDNKPLPSQPPSLFAHTPAPAPSFSSTTTFSSNQTNIFAQKPPSETPLFGQTKLQPSGFGAPSQPFASQNKFSFGMSTSSAPGFTTSPPNTTAPPVFSFGGATTSSNAFAFGSTPSTSTGPQPPFAFKTPANEPFKFGAPTTTSTTTTTTTTSKEANAFGPAATPSFSFGTQINNNPVQDQKPSFSFGASQPASSAPGFSFGTPAPSVFNFGGSTSSASSSSSFSFGTPTPGVPFGQTPSPGAPFAVPGTFNIGSGSSQSRPRASSRPRRRP